MYLINDSLLRWSTFFLRVCNCVLSDSLLCFLFQIHQEEYFISKTILVLSFRGKNVLHMFQKVTDLKSTCKFFWLKSACPSSKLDPTLVVKRFRTARVFPIESYCKQFMQNWVLWLKMHQIIKDMIFPVKYLISQRCHGEIMIYSQLPWAHKYLTATSFWNRTPNSSWYNGEVTLVRSLWVSCEFPAS